MSKQHGGLTMRNCPERFIEAGLTLEHIVHASYPQSGPGALNVKGMIPQDHDPMVVQRSRYEIRAKLIVITKDSENAQRGVQVAQNLCARRGTL
jgi:hypothetical protein